MGAAVTVVLLVLLVAAVVLLLMYSGVIVPPFALPYRVRISTTASPTPLTTPSATVSPAAAAPV